MIVLYYIFLIAVVFGKPPCAMRYCSDGLKLVGTDERGCGGRCVSNTPLLGADEDENGCVGSAGFSWCETKNKCIQSFSEDCPKKLYGANKDSNGCLTGGGYSWCESKSKCLRTFEEECPPKKATPQLLGDDEDDNGCKTSAGYVWCSTKNKCIQSFSEKCPETENESTHDRVKYHRNEMLQRSNNKKYKLGGKKDKDNCLSSAGYSYCHSKSKCIRSWEEECPTILGNDRDIINCNPGAGYSWCSSKNKCIRGWEEECTEDKNFILFPSEMVEKVATLFTTLSRGNNDFSSKIANLFNINDPDVLNALVEQTKQTIILQNPLLPSGLLG